MQNTIDTKELKRRLSIGFNDQLSIKQRKDLIRSKIPLSELKGKPDGFRSYETECNRVLSWLEKDSLNSIIWCGEDSFPEFPEMVRHVPYMLFCRGRRPDLHGLFVGVVGTRRATYGALHQAFRFGMETSANHLSLVSGFAEGVDQSSMAGAIAMGGPCLGVMACGLDVEYPLMSNRMRQRMMDNGNCSLISRFAPGSVPYKSNFVSRNMIIAAYSSFIVAVQAPAKSGTLITCEYAMNMGKEVFVGTEGLGDRPSQAGTTRLSKDGLSDLSSLADLENENAFPFRAVETAAADVHPSCRFGDKHYMVTKRL